MCMEVWYNDFQEYSNVLNGRNVTPCELLCDVGIMISSLLWSCRISGTNANKNWFKFYVLTEDHYAVYSVYYNHRHRSLYVHYKTCALPFTPHHSLVYHHVYFITSLSV